MRSRKRSFPRLGRCMIVFIVALFDFCFSCPTLGFLPYFLACEFDAPQRVQSSVLNTCCTAWGAASFAGQLGSSRLRCPNFPCLIYFSCIFSNAFWHLFSTVADNFKFAVLVETPEIQKILLHQMPLFLSLSRIFSVISVHFQGNLASSRLSIPGSRIFRLLFAESVNVS
jgi:hypothetical protein